MRIRPQGFFDNALLLQHFRRISEPLVLEKTIDQLLAWVLLWRDFVKLRILRQQHLTLNVDESSSHVHEFRTELDIQLECLLHVLEILRSDTGNGDVVDTNLLLANEVKQEIKRPLVLLKLEVQGERH